MNNIVDFKKLKEEENISFIADMIIDDIILNLEDNIEYKTNFLITGYNKQIDIIINKLKEQALLEKISMEIILQTIPSSSTNIIIKSFKSNDVFLKFIHTEESLYNKIMNDNTLVFDNNEVKISVLYILHALQTAIYHAGYEQAQINIDNKIIAIKSFNKIKKYMSKVVLMDMLKYNQKIEKERQENLNTKKLIR